MTHTLAELDQIVGEMTEHMNDKLDLPEGLSQDNIDYVIEWKIPTDADQTWYRLYKSGWVEQGGIYGGGSVNNPVISLPITMSNANYYVNCVNILDSRSTGNYMGHCIKTRATNSITLESSYYTSCPMCWEVKGMAVL